MSYASLLAHRCIIQRNQLNLASGTAEMTWTDVKTNVPCFIDLMFLRTGRDPVWSPEAGRAAVRVGVGFFKARAPIKNGDRIVVTKGPSGIFTLEMAIDEAWTPKKRSHLEVYLQALPQQLEEAYNLR